MWTPIGTKGTDSGSGKKGDIRRHSPSWSGLQLHGPCWEVGTVASPVPSVASHPANYWFFLCAVPGVRDRVENMAVQELGGWGKPRGIRQLKKGIDKESAGPECGDGHQARNGLCSHCAGRPSVRLGA